MSNSDNLKSKNKQPSAKKAHHDMLSSHHSQQSSQSSQKIIGTGPHQGQVNTRHAIHPIVNNNKNANEVTIDDISQSTTSSLKQTQSASPQKNKQVDQMNALKKRRQYQQKYRERNRDKLRLREAERRRRLQNPDMIIEVSNCIKLYREQNRDNLEQLEAGTEKPIQYSLSTDGPSTSSNTNVIGENTEETITVISRNLSGLDKTRTAYLKKNKKADRSKKQKEYQRRYRERNRDKLKQREAERRKRRQGELKITEVSNCPNIKSTGIINEPTRNEINADSRSAAGFGEVDEVSQQKPSASGCLIDRLTNEQNVDALKIRSTCESALDKNYVPNLSVNNRFPYQKIAKDLPKIDLITERLISPQIPVVQLRRLKPVQGQLVKYGQIINVPVAVDTVVQSRPKNVNDEYCIYVHIKKKIIYKISSVYGVISIESVPADESLDVPNFHSIAKLKRQTVRSAGVTIFKNKNTSHISTFNMDLAIRNATEVDVSQTSIGDMCASHVAPKDGSGLIMVVVHILPDKKIYDIILFLHERLFAYSYQGSMIFNTNKHKLPMILTGDFNVNFESDESLPLITFLQQEFQLKIDNSSREDTTRYGTTIDAVFMRHRDNVMANPSVTYFCSHRPIVAVISSEETSNLTIRKVTS